MIASLTRSWLPGAVLALACLGSAHAAAGAPQLYQAITMDDLADTLLLEGLRFSRVPIDGKGMVANERLDVLDGVDWSVLGYDCTPAKGCAELQMRAVFNAGNSGKALLAQMNAWNAANRFTRAYAVKNTKAILEMDIYLAGGQTLKNIRDQITIWRQSVRRFSTTLSAQDTHP